MLCSFAVSSRSSGGALCSNLHLSLGKRLIALFSDAQPLNLQEVDIGSMDDVGETSSPFELRFKSGVLKECPSAQLQSVGDLAEEGKCHVATMSGTIVYTVDY